MIFPLLASSQGRSAGLSLATAWAAVVVVPLAGALFGLVAPGQQISLPQWGGMIAVVAASIGASAIGWPPARNPD